MALDIKSIVEAPLVMPRTNMNGTSKEALIRQQMNILHACERLIEVMGEASPHGRDYQTYPDGNYFRQAQVQFTLRLTAVLKVKTEAEQTIMWLGSE